MFENRVRIKLFSSLGPKTLYVDPIGYDQSEIDLGRSEKTFGIFVKVVNNLEFTGDAKQYLKNLWVLYGVDAKCRLRREEKHPTTDDWQLHSDGYLDFYSWKEKEGKLSLDFVEGGLREILTSQMNEKFDLRRKIDIEGNTITDLQTDRLNLRSKKIFLRSDLESGDTTQFQVDSGEWNSGNDYRYAFQPFPLTVINNADPDNVSSVFERIGSDNETGGAAEQMFYQIANRDRSPIELKFKAAFSHLDGDFVRESDVYCQVEFRTYSGGDSYILESTEIVLAMGDPVNFIPGDNFNIDFSKTIEPLEGYSYSIGVSMKGKYGDGISKGSAVVDFDNYSASLSLEEDSFFQNTVSPCLDLFDAGDRIGEIFTGQTGRFESYLLSGQNSSLLTDDNHKLITAPGGWLRNLKVKDDQGNTEEWPFELSFENLYKTVHAFTPSGYGMLKKGNIEKIVLEDLKFFFRREVMGDLGKIDIKERSNANEFCYQSLVFGYEEGGDYEKPLGLDECNTKQTVRTPLTGTDAEYNAVSPSRTDPTGAEDARRQQYDSSNDKDTPYDKSVFIFDSKKTGGSAVNRVFEVREPLDDFEEMPTGVYSPETRYNYNLTPARNKYRHSWWFNNSIWKLQNKNIQFVNAVGNSQLRTKKPGEPYIKENEQEIPISSLSKPYFQNEWIDAEKPFDQELFNKMLGTTRIGDRDINNYYGLWKFKNEQNRTEYAYIFTVKSKDKFTFKLLKAYGI